MASMGRPFVFLLILVLAAIDQTISADPPEMKPGMRPETKPDTKPEMKPEIKPGGRPLPSKHQEHIKNMARKMMLNCLEKGYQVPVVKQNISQQLGIERVGEGLLPVFLDSLKSLPTKLLRGEEKANRDPLGKVPALPLPKQFLNKTLWSSSNLQDIVKMIKKAPEADACFMHAFIAPFSWDLLMQGKDMSSEDFDRMVWAAMPLLKNMPDTHIALPQTIKKPNMERMTKMLKEMYTSLSENQRDQIKDWLRQQVAQNSFNCTLKPKPKTRSRVPRPGTNDGLIDQCPRELMWLKMEVMKMMGPYLSQLRIKELDAAPNDQLCQFFQSEGFGSSFVGKIKPMLARRFIERIKECPGNQEDLSQQLERLGTLACYYKDDPPSDITLKSSLLKQLDNCDNSGAQKLKKNMVSTLMSLENKPSSKEMLSILGSSVSLLSPDQLSMFSVSDLRETLGKQGPGVKLRLGQAKRLAKRLLQDNGGVTAEDIMMLGSAVKGLPTAMLKKLKAKEILANGSLGNITERMTKGQREAIMDSLRKNMQASELIRKLPASLLSALPLNVLKNANLTSLDQVEGKQWTLPQSAFLVKSLMSKDISPKDIRRLGSAIQGMSCKMMERVSEKDSSEMVDALTQAPQWLSKTQTSCAARKLFATLESERSGYFVNITVQELEDIPTLMLIHLHPRKVKTLPDSVCPTFLTKMKTANLSSLSPGSLSRPALTGRALLCLAHGRNLSEISSEEMLDLGQLLCELPPAKLRLLGPEVRNSSLEVMAACAHIPRRHHSSLLRLLKETYGNVSDWSQATMESFSALLLLNGSEITSLKFKPWLKEVLSDLKESMMQHSSNLTALRERLFSLKTQPKRSRRRRTEMSSIDVPTVAMIEDLGDDNVFWSPDQLKLISSEILKMTTTALGAITEFRADQLSVFKEKIEEAFGPVGEYEEDMVIQIGCLSQSFSDRDLMALPLALGTLEELSACGWQQTQREAIWKGYSKRSEINPEMLGAADIVALDQFMCGLSPEEVGKLQLDAFRDTAIFLGGLQCPLSVTKEYAKIAVTSFGEPSQWTEADVSTLGKIVAGLDGDGLSSLGISAFSFISKDSIPLITPNVFSSVSVPQLMGMGPDNALMVTAEQRSALGIEKQAALDVVLTGIRVEDDGGEEPPTAAAQSGAPSLAIEGTAETLKPFLFLFLGLLLL